MLGSQVAENVDKVDQMMQLKGTIGYLVDNVFAGDIAALDSWKSGSHVENPSKKKPTP